MRLLPLLPLLLAPRLVLAAGDVLVTGFQPADPDSAGLAAMLSSVLEAALVTEDEIHVLPLDDVPALVDVEARLYLECCPPGQQAGCAYVVADHAGAAYAVGGSLRVGDPDIAVHLVLVDVGEAREAVAMDLALPPGEDERLMAEVAELLGRLIRGEIGRLVDIREDGRLLEGRALDPGELEQVLAEGLGSRRLRRLRTGLSVAMPTFTPQDMERMKAGAEGLTEWERLGMNERAYLRWRNSGLDLTSWRRLQAGRALQVLVRPHAGFLWGPLEGSYLARIAMDPTLVETYAWQGTSGAVGGGYGLDLGFGLTPAVDLEGGVQVAHSRFHVLVQQEVVGEPVLPREPTTTANTALLLTAGLRVVPTPARALRPLLGAGVVFWRGTGVDDHTDLSSLQLDIPRFPAPRLLGPRALVGAELRLGPRWDMVAQVPMMLLVGTQWGLHDEDAGYLSDKDVCPVGPPFAAGLELGIQARLGGRRGGRAGPRGGQGEDEDELEGL